MEGEDLKKSSGLTYLLLGLGAGILVTAAIVVALKCMETSRVRDPRGEKVRGLIEEAEHLIALGRRGAYASKRMLG